ncbi:MAG: hypothetical protein WCO93_04700 [bacterium]
MTFLLVISLTSCEKFSGDQEIPSYISIDSIYLTTNYTNQGTSSHNITDAWIYVDDIMIGDFELPARVPVLFSGTHTVTVIAGIKKNGIASTRVDYRFYQPIVKTLRLTPDSTTNLKVQKTVYMSSAKFVWLENFEGVAFTLDTTKRSSAAIERTPTGSPLAFKDEGLHSGMVVLDSAHSFFECQSHDEYPIPPAPVYLEMNFNINTTLTVGVVVYGLSSLYQVPIINLNPTNNLWKKIYIDLTTTINAYSGYTYRVYLGAFHDSTSNNQNLILFDNFKILTNK